MQLNLSKQSSSISSLVGRIAIPKRRIWRLTDGFSDRDVSHICRNEFCTRKDLHAPHPVEDTSKEQKRRGWKLDPFEKERWTAISIDCSTGKQPSKHSLKENIKEIPRPPSHRSCPRGLVRAVAMSVSSVRIKVISEIHQDVLDQFGTVDARTVYRGLARLVQRGCIIRVSFDHGKTVPFYSSQPLGVHNGVVLEKIRGCEHVATKHDKCPECGKQTWKDDPPRGTLSGYLRPTSRLFHDPFAMKDQLWEATSGLNRIEEVAQQDVAA